MASSRFLGLWYCSQSLSLAKSLSFLDSSFRPTSLAAAAFLPTSSYSAAAMAAAFFSIPLIPSTSISIGVYPEKPLKQPASLVWWESRGVWGFIYPQACGKVGRELNNLGNR